MSTVQSVLEAIERLAPSSTAFDWDRIGLQTGDPSAEVRVAAVALDPSPGSLGFAIEKSAQILLCHHPVLWDPVTSVAETSRSGRLASAMIRHSIAFIAAHTNWDAAPDGINGCLAELLGLQEPMAFGSGSEVPYRKIVVFAPESSAEAIVDALAAAGAGTIGLYERCAFGSPGTGTFVGRPEARPSVGQAGRREEVSELRIEMRVPLSHLAEAVLALRSVHPYEEPAFDVYPMHSFVERPMGRIGQLEEPLRLVEFKRFVDAALETRSWVFGDPERPVSKIAVCGGAADDEWRAALAAGADVFVTGEVKHHNALEASESGMAIVAAGHFATEQPGTAALAKAMAAEIPDVDWQVYVPPIGQAGRALFHS